PQGLIVLAAEAGGRTLDMSVRPLWAWAQIRRTAHGTALGRPHAGPRGPGPGHAARLASLLGDRTRPVQPAARGRHAGARAAHVAAFPAGDRLGFAAETARPRAHRERALLRGVLLRVPVQRRACAHGVARRALGPAARPDAR